MLVWLPIEGLNEHAKTCRFNNCKHTENKDVLRTSSAIVFCKNDCVPLNQPPLNANERPLNQVWIYFGLESPATQEQLYKRHIPSWKNSFNWSMTYQLNSDIVIPYGVLTAKQFAENRNLSDIFRGKSKWAAWLVNQCNVPSLRDKFVDKVRKHGLPVDIFGRCGKELTTDPEKMISSEYKFYMSFENSMCEDYLTEKVFKYFNYDTILVVRGGANYKKKLFPKHTFIDTADFKSFKSLVDYLKLVGNNGSLYTTYLRNKARYTSTGFSNLNLSYCAVCNKLNYVNMYKKTYERIPKNLQKCCTPGGIDMLDNH